MAKKKNGVGPREVPNRDNFYMGLAFWMASKSKDPNTQVGAIIVAKNNGIIGLGYNGPPASYNDEDLDWSRPNKNDHIIHAEKNAIKWCTAKWLLPESTIYVTAKPCKGCISDIANEGIAKVVYYPLSKKDDPGSSLNTDKDIVDDIIKRSKIEIIEFKGNLNWMRDRMLYMEKVLSIF